MDDLLAHTRRKARFIAEIRYPHAPRFFDIRGGVIASLHARVKERFPIWRSDPGYILFGDREERPANQFYVGVERVAFRLEDPPTLQEFVDLATKHFRWAFDLLNQHITELTRVGVRFISVHAKDEEVDFAHYAALVREKFHRLPADLSLDYNDSLVHLVHKHGYYIVGPVRPGEAWIASTFLNPKVNVPPAGIGLDVDSFASGIPYQGADKAARAFRAVLELTAAAEEAIARHAGLLDA